MNRTTSIGLEIEVNNFDFKMERELDGSLWSTATEHCGVEIRSVPCKGPHQIRRLMSSLKEMERWSNRAGFNNAGTHIHIDFLRDLDPSRMGELKRKNADRLADGTFANPTGTGKKYYWVDANGTRFARPSDYAAYVGKSFNSPIEAFKSRKSSAALLSVKRFLALGIRFSDVIMALQHPDRRFNKYCHTIGDWDEDLLFKARSVSEICSNRNLAQGHRRHAINALAFNKYGTIEIRVIKASLSYDLIWPQIFFFTRMASLAKSSDGLPESTGKVTVDFQVLMDACDIHGKIRRSLTDTLKKNLDMPNFNIRCYSCDTFTHHGNYIDIGLSRGLCFDCVYDRYYCVRCKASRSRHETNLSSRKLDNMIEKGRYLCESCYRNCLADILDYEKKHGVVYVHGEAVGSGFDSNGFKALRRMRALFSG